MQSNITTDNTDNIIAASLHTAPNESTAVNYSRHAAVFMPSLFLSNVNRILNKLDEISIVLRDKCPDIVAFTETWLNHTIPDTVIDMNCYSVLRKDRRNKMGGGVMLYIRDGHK